MAGVGTTMLTENDPTMDMYFRQVATYDPVTDKAYTVSWGNGKPLVSIDLNTMETKSIGQVNKFIQTLFTDKDGQLYGIGYNDMILYKIDKTTGAPTEVGKVDPPFNLSADPMSAVCDPATGKIYWVAVDGGGKESALFTIDPATAHVEKITDLPGNEHFLGLYVPYTEAGAPAAPSGIGYANGKLTFTAPSKTYTTGEELSGGLTAFVTVDNGNAIEKSVSPGENVSLELRMADGSHVITIALSNAAGMSPERRLNTFVGQDVPSAVTDLTLAIDDGETAELTWNAPTTSMNNGPVDDASINYKVVRYPDETVVAEGLKETRFSESVPEAHASYYYTVTALSGDRVGGTASSNKVTAGSTWFPPYIEHFDTQADFDSFKVIDANNDGATWSLMLPYGEESGYAYLTGNGTADVDTGIYYGDGNDDYLISPQISLKKGAEYRLTFETSPDQWMTLEHMTVLLGGKKDVTGDERVLASLDLPYDKNFYDIRFSVEEDGLYYLLFHGDSPAESVNVGMDNISIDVYSTFLGPDCVTDVKVEAGEKGALSNTLTFTTPTKKYNGDALDEISYINVYRNGSNKPAHVFESPKTGETLTWTDTDVEQGNVSYRIVPFNADGQGEEAIINNWVGLDMPANVTNLTVKMNADNKAVLTWDKASDKGMHGGYVNPDDVQYVLCRYNEYNWTDHWEQVTDYTKELTLTDETFSPLYGAQQQYVDYLLVAVNGAGASEGTGAGIVLGEPYERPYTESFAGGYASKDPWTLSASSYNYAWNMVTGSGISVKPYDGDEGMLQFSLLDDDSNNQVLMGPRISLDGSEAPEISFFMYHGFEAEEGDLTLKIYTNYDDEGWENTANVDYNNGSYGWSRYSLPLRSDADNVQIAFGAYAADASASIYLDGLKIDENWKTGVATFNGYGGSQTVIQFYGDAPIFIDDITITQKESSETVSTISAPVIMDATDVTDNSFTANWQTVTTATAYLLDVFYFSDNQPQYVIKDYQTTNTSEPVSGLQAGRLYYYSVQATDGTLTSDESAIMAAIKPVQDLDTPVATAATEVSKDGFRANWNSVDSAAYYSLTTVSEYKVPQSGTFVLDDETFDKVTSGTINAPEYNSIECSLDQYTEHPDWLGITTLLANGMIGLKNYYAMMGSYSMLYSPLYQVSTANPGEIKATISAQMVNCTNGTRLGVALVDAETGDILGNGWQFVTLSNEMTSYDFDLGTSNYYYIAIGFSDPNDTYGTTGMVFIDDVKITQEMEAGTTLSRIYRYDTAYNNSFYIETPDSPDGENFYYYVTAVSNGTDDYVYSEPSNVVIVDTNTGIGNAVTADGTTITASAGQINISTTEACAVSVFDMSGRTVRQFDAVEGSTSFPIEPGAYIVKCGETVRKVLVR